jgi:hypothetical protein
LFNTLHAASHFDKRRTFFGRDLQAIGQQFGQLARGLFSDNYKTLLGIVMSIFFVIAVGSKMEQLGHNMGQPIHTLP